MAKKTTQTSNAVKTNRRQSPPVHWENAYRLPLFEIPWEIDTPPNELVQLIESGRITPCNALDVACGSGNYSIYLAKNGFDVTGVDFSKAALRLADKKVEKIGLEKRVHLLHADVRHLSQVMRHKRFGFILDWSLLHHIAPDDFAAYTNQFSKLLQPGGVLLLACFSDQDAPNAGVKQAVGSLGNVMHYRTRNEIETAYRPLKVLAYQECRLGKKKQHAAHCFLFQKPMAATKKS